MTCIFKLPQKTFINLLFNFFIFLLFEFRFGFSFLRFIKLLLWAADGNLLESYSNLRKFLYRNTLRKVSLQIMTQKYWYIPLCYMAKSCMNKFTFFSLWSPWGFNEGMKAAYIFFYMKHVKENFPFLYYKYSI